MSGESRSAGSDIAGITHWSLVLAAGQAGHTAAQALESLCQQYWPAVYGFIRRRTPSVDEAQDLTQEFFAYFLEHNGVSRANPERGKFRAYLFTSVRNFLASQAERRKVLRRGGGCRTISFDFSAAESHVSCASIDWATPESVFIRQWAHALLDQTISRLRQEYETVQKLAVFKALLPWLGGAPNVEGHPPLAQTLGCSDAAARQAVSRFRKRYRDLLRREIAQTLEQPTDAAIDAELRDLFAAVSVAGLPREGT